MQRPERRLTRRDFATNPVTLALALLGAHLVHVTRQGRLTGRIVETEAYLGADDLAAHSRGGRRTQRTEPMFAKAGTAYVFRTYGMHDLLNVVCGAEGEPVAVLLRALEPIEGSEIMRENRVGTRTPVRALRDVDLCSGPARLTQALGIDRSYNHIDLATNETLFLEGPYASIPDSRITKTKRIGVDYAGDWADRPHRYYLTGSAHVSRPLHPPRLLSDGDQGR